MIDKNLILLNKEIKSKKDAIEMSGKLLYENGCVKHDYIDSMHQRDQKLSVYMGNMIAIPHGTDEARSLVIKTGVSMIQVPSGIDFDGNQVKIIFGIAANGDDHLDIISKIAILCSDIDNVEKLAKMDNIDQIIEMILSGDQ